MDERALRYAMGQTRNPQFLREVGAKSHDRRQIDKMFARHGIVPTHKDREAVLAFSEFLKIAGPIDKAFADAKQERWNALWLPSLEAHQ